MKSFSDFGITLPQGASGPEVYVTCPQCSQMRKKKNVRCLSVNLEKKVFICHHCGFAGGLGKEPSYASRVNIYRRPDPIRQATVSEKLLDWITKRGISEEAARRNKIESASIYFGQIEDFAEAIVFPYYRKGELINRKFRMIADKKFRLESGCELILYGLDDIAEGKPLIWVEGEADKLALETAGYLNVVSVPNGAPAENSKNYENLFSYLDTSHEEIGKVKKHIIAVDSDDPGRRLEDELARRLGVDICLRTRWPDGCKDANDVLIKHGSEDLRWYIDNAEEFPIDDALDPEETKDDVQRFFFKGHERGISTGWKILDRYYTVKPGQFTAVTGIPSSGKSNWLDHLIVNLAKNHDWKIAVFSPEQMPVEEQAAALLEKYIGLPFHAGYKTRMTEMDLDLAMEWLQKHFVFILPGARWRSTDEEKWTLDRILATAAKLCVRRGIHGLVIDPWNELEPHRPNGTTETDYIGMSLQRIKRFARTHKIHIWVVVHPTKLARDKNGEYPVPTLYDCAGSSNWRNKCDNGICIWRDLNGPDTAEVQIHVQKIRYRSVGERGMAKLYYDKPCATYSEFNPKPERGER